MVDNTRARKSVNRSFSKLPKVRIILITDPANYLIRLQAVSRVTQKIISANKTKQNSALLWQYYPEHSPEVTLASQGPNLPDTKFFACFKGALDLIAWTPPSFQELKISYSIVHAVPVLLTENGYQPRFALLPGDFGKDEKESKIVSAINNNDNEERIIHCLIAASGTGKTKALFDLARTKFSIYFEFGTVDTERDEYQFTEKLVNFLAGKSTTDFDSYNDLVQYEMLVLRATRLVVLVLMKMKFPDLTPEQWLLTQLNWYYSERRSLFNSIRIVLYEHYPSYAELIKVMDLFRPMTGQSMFVMCDNAHRILNVGQNIFPANDSSLFARSIYHEMISQYIKFESVLVAGTTMALKNHLNIGPDVAGPVAQISPKMKIYTDFQCISSVDDCSAIFHRLFDVALTASQVQTITDRVQGRPQYIILVAYVAVTDSTFYQRKGRTNENILMDLVDLVHDYLAYGKNAELLEQWIEFESTLYSIVDDMLQTRDQHVINFLGGLADGNHDFHDGPEFVSSIAVKRLENLVVRCNGQYLVEPIVRDIQWCFKIQKLMFPSSTIAADQTITN